MKIKSTKKQIITLILIILFIFSITIFSLKTEIFATTIVLPSGSTSNDLQDAVNNSVSEDTIIISSDMEFSTRVNIPEDKNITIESSSDNIWTLYPTNRIVELFRVYGSLTFQNITIDGKETERAVYANGNLTINSNTTLQNCYTGNNGAAIHISGGTLVMNDGLITNNVSNGTGGGIAIYNNGMFTMNDGVISNNKSNSYGGAVFAGGDTFIMNNGTIIGNSANIWGGGIMNYSTFSMYDGNIIENKASSGGIQNHGVVNMYNGNVSNNIGNRYF